MRGKSSITEVAAAAEGDWITLLKDNGRTGGSGAPTVPSPTKARWQLRLGSPVRSSPVLREATLYVTAQRGQLYALKTKDGRQEWKFEAGGKINSTPSLSGSNVLFGCDNGKVYAVNGDNGTKVWEATTDEEVWASNSVEGGDGRRD
jgi:outer membrane protein assembly factor BamB